MTDTKLSYLGPLPNAGEKLSPRWGLRLPVGFLIVVALPTLVAAIYFLIIASPRYVSEARFVVRSPANEQPSTLGMALSGVGLSAGTSDAFAVHEYLQSRDGLAEIDKSLQLRRMYGRPGIDPFSRLPGPFQNESFEAFHKGFNRYVTVGYDSASGISTLRVEAFKASDAQKISQAMLQAGEQLVNRLNERAANDAVAEAHRSVTENQARLLEAQNRLTTFRNAERFIDPARTAQVASELIGELTVQLATLRAERAQIAANAPDSPQLAVLDSRIRAYAQQIALEQSKIVGDADSLAPKISTYERLALEREFADKLLAQATATLASAQTDARRQRLYLDQIVRPNLPDEPTQPKRFLAVLAVLASSLVIYGLGMLVWAGLRESRTS